jgi:hypothetical protein
MIKSGRIPEKDYTLAEQMIVLFEKLNANNIATAVISAESKNAGKKLPYNLCIKNLLSGHY